MSDVEKSNRSHVSVKAPPRFIRCDMTSPAWFGSSDARAGYYEPGQILAVGEDLGVEKATALLAGGGFTACDKEGK